MPIELVQKRPRKQKSDAVPVTQPLSLISLRDRYSTYPSKDLTPQRLASILQEADSGDIFRQMELFEEMLEKDGHMFAIFQARKLAVSGKKYSIVPASDDQEDIEIASSVEDMIERIRGWKNSLNDILDCVAKGFSVNEIYWTLKGERYEIERLRWQHQKKFRFGRVADIDSDPEEIRLVVEPRQIEAFRGLVSESELARATSDGIGLDSDPSLRLRFAIGYCKARSGVPGRSSLMRTLTYLYLFKNFDVKWWVQFAEKMLGYVIGKYDPNQPDQKELLEKVVRGLATDAVAVVSNTTEIEFAEMLQKASSHQVYKELKNWCNEEMTKAVLGHTGTTESTPGKLGSEDAAREVRQELVEADAEVLDEVITDEIIVPFVKMNFGEREAYPYYKTDVSKAPDLTKQVQIDQGLQRMGFPITKKYIKDTYGRPLPNPKDEEDEVLQPIQNASVIPFAGRALGMISGARKKKLLSSR